MTDLASALGDVIKSGKLTFRHEKLRKVARKILSSNPNSRLNAAAELRKKVYEDIELARAMLDWVEESFGDPVDEYLSDLKACEIAAARAIGHEKSPSSQIDRSRDAGGVGRGGVVNGHHDCADPIRTKTSGGVQGWSAPHQMADTPARTPTPQHKAVLSGAELRAAMSAVSEVARKSVLDTFRMNDGRPIGDVTPDEADAFVVVRRREARFVELLCYTLPRGKSEPIRHYYSGESAGIPDKLFARAMRGDDK